MKRVGSWSTRAFLGPLKNSARLRDQRPQDPLCHSGVVEIAYNAMAIGRVILDCAIILDARLNREIRRVQRIERNDVPAVERVAQHQGHAQHQGQAYTLHTTSATSGSGLYFIVL